MTEQQPISKNPNQWLCAICGKREAPSGKREILIFAVTLARHGIPGKVAHPECVAALPPCVPMPLASSSSD
jgi:hypothetical protein